MMGLPTWHMEQLPAPPCHILAAFQLPIAIITPWKEQHSHTSTTAPMQAPEVTEEHPSVLRQLSTTALKAASQLVQAGRAAIGHEGTDGGAAPAAAEEPQTVAVTKVGRGMTPGTALICSCCSCSKGASEGRVYQGGEGLEADGADLHE